MNEEADRREHIKAALARYEASKKRKKCKNYTGKGAKFCDAKKD